MSHTAGPWEWIDSPEGYGYSALVGAENAEVLVPGGINDGDCPITWMGEESTEDDRALIASAPNLLATCERVVAWLERNADKHERHADQYRDRFPELGEACLADAKNFRATAKSISKAIAGAKGD